MKRQSFNAGFAVFLFSSVFLMTGCGAELSYKRGASADAFQNEKQRCENTSSSEKEIDQCLQDQGWLVVSPDKPLIPSSRGNNRSTISVASDAMADTAGQPADPMEQLSINSWWRAGAGPEKLMQDSEACTAELGEAHLPKANMSLVTRALLSCMQNEGWAALLTP
ncbi:MAG: hypothetical protein R3341_03085 [Methylophaga sp.]|nr:hypothetical protein [Methylophaga sp.]